MQVVLRLLGCGVCAGVGVGSAWVALTLGGESVLDERGLLLAGGVIGFVAPWVYTFAGRQLGTSGDIADRYERGRGSRRDR